MQDSHDLLALSLLQVRARHFNQLLQLRDLELVVFDHGIPVTVAHADEGLKGACI